MKYMKYIFYDRAKSQKADETVIPALGTGPSFKERDLTSGNGVLPFAFMSTSAGGFHTRFYVHSYFAAA